MKIIDLRSDTVTKPDRGMLDAMMRAEVGDDVWGDDPTVNALQAATAALLGKPAGLFLPSGTMANQVAIRAHVMPGDEVILDRESHIFRYEVAAAAVVSGAQFNAIDGDGGVMTAAQVAAAVRPIDIHQPRTTLVCLENTHNRAGGTIFPLDELRRVSAVCRKHKIPIHLDGARLWNASVAAGIPLAEYARHCDSVMVCFSKGLGCPVGSVLVGTKGFIGRARRGRKLFGGGMRQAGYLAAAGIYALKHNVKRLAEDHARAARLARLIAEVPSLDIDLAAVQTNIVIFDCARTGMDSEKALKKCAARGLWLVSFGRTRLRAVTHLDVGDAGIERAGKVLRTVFR
ncbi:MAG: low-specificity L-threonine aldolase [Candidatus Edwardsbacteria bacterium]|nr:low-specificity L-threonine aldolase [Candidatus Edwardsbacteria bacterium]